MSDNGWIEHDGKGMPVCWDVLVGVKFRDGDVFEFPLQAGNWRPNWIFEKRPDRSDITHYRIVKENPDA